MNKCLVYADAKARAMGTGLRKWRGAMHISLRSFAKMSGVSASTLSRFENGRSISIEHGFAIQRAIEIRAHKPIQSARVRPAPGGEG